MKNSLLNKYTLIFKLILKNYSPLRIFQILEINKLKIDQEVLDLGSIEDDRNVSNYIENSHLRIYSNYKNINEGLNINLEKFPNEIKKKFKIILLMNVLEHIKNFENCFKNVNDLLEEGGVLYGSTPFLFHIHPAPNDYYRFTKQFLEECLIENGYKDLSVKVLGTGIFCCFYASFFHITKRIPLLNLIIFPIMLILDKCINIFSRHTSKNNPLGYFFIAKKTR